MSLTPELRDKLTSEMKQFASSLNLSDDQKRKVQDFLSNAYEKVQEYRQQNPSASREDLIQKITENRSSIRQRLVGFLTPEQLTKWDAEVAKAKDFLSEKMGAKFAAS